MVAAVRNNPKPRVASSSRRRPRRSSAAPLLLVLLLVVALFLFLLVGNAPNRAGGTKADDAPEAARPADGVETNDEPPEEEGPTQVCKSDASGTMNCRDPSSEEGSAAAESTTISAGGEERHGEPFRCADVDEGCADRSAYRMGDSGKGEYAGACEANSAYMSQYCPVSCGTCETVHLGYRLSRMLEGGLAVIPFCQDNDFHCGEYASAGECDENPGYMRVMCEASCGICSEESNQFGVGQRLQGDDPDRKRMTSERLAQSAEYMSAVRRDRKYARVRDHCLNKAPDCTLWAAMGECDKNPEYMKFMCAPACMSCDHLGDTSETCPGLPEDGTGPLWKEPGDLNRFFENVVDDANGSGEYLRYNPRALSRPRRRSDGTAAPGDDDDDDGPWVVLLENFVTEEEADRLVRIGEERGYERSVRTVAPGESAATDARTSDTAWCDGPCAADPLVAGLLERIATVTGSTTRHGEHLQLLRYSPGQRYRSHHDYVPYQLDMPCGPRIATLLLYLSDVEEGGETVFPGLRGEGGGGLSVGPRRGSALLWPSVRDDDPTQRDPRTEHEAAVVRRGTKHAANAWIHAEDFQTPLALGCI